MPSSETLDHATPGFLVWRLSMKWRVAVDRALAGLGLTHAQYSLLGSLLDLQRSGVTPTQRELAEHTGLEALYVSKLARALDVAGIITRTAHPQDSRAVQVALTASGRKKTEKAVAIVGRLLEDELLAPLGGSSSRRTAAFAAALRSLLVEPTD